MSKIKELAKDLCDKSTCHHKCPDTDKCVVEEEAELLINQEKSNNFEVKSNNDIGEMAKDLDEALVYFKGIPRIINWVATIKNLLNKGWRKQSGGEWNENGRCSICEWYMPFDCEGNAFETLYCPNCGAKMKGGAK